MLIKVRKGDSPARVIRMRVPRSWTLLEALRYKFGRDDICARSWLGHRPYDRGPSGWTLGHQYEAPAWDNLPSLTIWTDYLVPGSFTPDFC